MECVGGLLAQLSGGSVSAWAIATGSRPVRGPAFMRRHLRVVGRLMHDRCDDIGALARDVIGKPSFKVSDAFVQEAVVRAGGGS
jgi:hypothetical protein